MIASLPPYLRLVLAHYGVEEDALSTCNGSLVIHADSFEEACDIRHSILSKFIHSVVLAKSPSGVGVVIENAFDSIS